MRYYNTSYFIINTSVPTSDHRESKKEFKLRGYRQKMRKAYPRQKNIKKNLKRV